MSVKRLSPPTIRGRRAWLALVGLLLIATGVQGAESSAGRKPHTHPYLESWYDGSRNLPLGACSAGTLTEQDFLLFRMMKRAKAPDLIDQWAESRRAKKRAKLTKAVEGALEELANTLVLAGRAADRVPTELDEKGIRFLKYPIYQWVWIDQVLRPMVQIEDIDLIKYYHDNTDKFYKPESVRVRYIFREVSDDKTIAERDKLEQEMNALRARAAGGEDFVELARAESDAPSAVRGGELPVIYRRMFVEEFESGAFALEPGELSPVFWGPGGLYLIQCLEKKPERQQSFESARKKLRDQVEHKTLKYLYDYELRRRLGRRNYRNYYGRFLDMPREGRMFIIGEYELTKNEFLDLFPSTVMPPLTFDRRLIAGIGKDLLAGELVAQDVERRGLTGHPLLVAADRLARQIWRADEVLRKTMSSVPLTFSEAEVRSYYEENRERMGDQPQWRVLRITADVLNPYLRHPSQLEALRSETRTQFEEVLLELRSALGEERARQLGEWVLAGESSPLPLDTGAIPEDEAATETARIRRQILVLPRALRILGDASTTDFEFTVTDLGFVSERDARVYKYVKGLREGDHSRIGKLKTGGLSCYFVERYIPGAPREYEEITTHVRQQYIASLQSKAFEKLGRALEREAALRIRLPEIASQEE